MPTMENCKATLSDDVLTKKEHSTLTLPQIPKGRVYLVTQTIGLDGKQERQRQKVKEKDVFNTKNENDDAPYRAPYFQNAVKELVFLSIVSRS
jgi:hypothetical protein